MTHSAAPPFAFSNGSREAKIALVGEAFGETEAALGAPFLGAAGYVLATLCYEAGLVSSPPFRVIDDRRVSFKPEELKEWWSQSGIFLTNLLAMRPSASSNDFSLVCTTKAGVGKNYPFGPIHQGKYLRPEFFSELERLQQELLQVKPNITIALGGKAAWAFLGGSYISKLRGTVSTSDLLRGAKVLATYHPSYILQGGFSERPIMLADLMKARKESGFAEFRRPERSVLVSPTLGELRSWVDETLRSSPALLSCDIETKQGQIESIGFARSREEAIVCPFLDVSGKFPRSYWSTAQEEIEALKECERLLASDIPKLFQNGMFDIQWLLRYRLRLRNCVEDTMLLHHALFPELQKGLGFLGSIYTGESQWKLMRKRAKEEELKTDD